MKFSKKLTISHSEQNISGASATPLQGSLPVK